MAVYLSKISTKQFACSKQKCYIWLIKSVVCIIIHIYKKILPIEQSLMEGLLGPPVVPQFRSPPFNKRQSCLSPFFWKTQYWHPSSAYNPQNSWQCLASAILSVFKSGSPRYSQSCFIKALRTGWIIRLIFGCKERRSVPKTCKLTSKLG